MTLAVALIMFVVGAVFGSFACCQAWRLHLKDTGKGKMAKSKWSVCMDCKYRLKWYDNIPVISWVVLRGKCRKCGKKIGGWEILSEVGLGVVFAVFGVWFYGNFASLIIGNDMTWQLWVLAGLVMAMLVGFAILFIADARWGRLPVGVLTFCIICAILFATTREWGVFAVAQIWDYLGALLVLPVLYYLLYKISGEKWVGSGDWLLALPIALVLGNFWLAFFCVFAANLMGCFVMIPVMMRKKKNMNMRVAFGPFLIVAFMIVFLAQEWVLGLMG